MARRVSASNPSEITAGSVVTYRLAGRPVRAEVVEDRGPVGWNGRRLLRIRTMNELEEVRETFEIPADEVTLAD